ncbi:MAG: DUF4271 domain-containing protein [Sphingobacteriales bacterium]|nr:DUF4271 domain-containing protein [Sphingobacteriales bacterium]
MKLKAGILLCFSLTFFSLTYSQKYHPSSDTTLPVPFTVYHFQYHQDSNLWKTHSQIIKMHLLYPEKPREKYNLFSTYLFFALIFMLLIVLLIRILNPDYFLNIFRNTYSTTSFLDNLSKKEAQSFLLINNIILDIIFIFSLSLFFLKLSEIRSVMGYWQIFRIITLLYLVQIMIIRIFYRVFFKRGTENVHLSQILTFNRMAGVLLIPFLILIYFASPPINKFAFEIIKVFLIVMILFRLIKNYFIIKKINLSNLFYVLLYLCVFEISLYFAIIKEFIGLNHN